MRLPLAGVVVMTLSVLHWPSGAAAAQEATRMTSASNVRLRGSNSEQAPIVATLPLGTPLIELEHGADGWVRARLATGETGWVPARFTLRFTRTNKIQIIEGVIKERLGRQGDSFAARAELVGLIERAIDDVQDAEAKGRFALAWVRAMDGALGAIPFSAGRREPPYADWLNARDERIVYNEPGGQWMVPHERVWALQYQHADTASGDDLAWAAVSNGLQGECEGFVPCYAHRMNLLDGEYLRRRPSGRRVDEVIERIVTSTKEWSAQPYFFDPAKDCAELVPLLDALRAAVASTRNARRDEALSVLDVVRRPCRDASTQPPARLRR